MSCLEYHSTGVYASGPESNVWSGSLLRVGQWQHPSLHRLLPSFHALICLQRISWPLGLGSQVASYRHSSLQLLGAACLSLSSSSAINWPLLFPMSFITSPFVSVDSHIKTFFIVILMAFWKGKKFKHVCSISHKYMFTININRRPFNI